MPRLPDPEGTANEPGQRSPELRRSRPSRSKFSRACTSTGCSRARQIHALHTPDASLALGAAHPRPPREARPRRARRRTARPRAVVSHRARRRDDPSGRDTRRAPAASHDPRASIRPAAGSHPRGERHRDRVRQRRPRARWRRAAARCRGGTRSRTPRRRRAGRHGAHLLIADALLSYLQGAPDDSLILHQRFIELDRGRSRADQLAAKLARYAQLRHYATTKDTPRDRCGGPTTARSPGARGARRPNTSGGAKAHAEDDRAVPHRPLTSPLRDRTHRLHHAARAHRTRPVRTHLHTRRTTRPLHGLARQHPRQPPER